MVHTNINPTQIVPKGPDLTGWFDPHGREELGGRPFGDGTPPASPPLDEMLTALASADNRPARCSVAALQSLRAQRISSG